MLSVDAQTVLRRTRAAIADGRWTKGKPHAGGGHRCVAAHVGFFADADRRLRHEVLIALNDTAKKNGYRSIVLLNDHPLTTKKGMVSFIDETLSGG